MEKVNASTPQLRLDKLLSQLGYATRKEVSKLLREGRVTHREGSRLRYDQKVCHGDILFDGETLDPPAPLILMLHKPKGFVCTRSDGEGKTVFELLPMRYTLRNPPLVCVGRLDMDTTGLLLITDDGDFVHRMTSPRHHVEKEYCVTLEQPLKGDESSAFAKGGIILGEDEEPLIPSTFTQTGSHTGTLIITEGRYHQIKRTFGVLGNTVTELHRPRVGEYTLGNLAVGEFVIVR